MAYQTLSGSRRALSMAKGLILPGSVSSVGPYPSTTPAQLCTRIIKKNFVLGAANISVNGRSAIVVTPDLYGPAHILRPGTVTIPTAPGPFSMSVDITPDVSYALYGIKGLAQFKSGDGSKSDLCLPSAVNLGGDIRAAWDITCASVCTLTINMVKTAVRAEGYERVCFFTSTGGAWQPAFKGPSLPKTGMHVQLEFTMGAGTRYFGMYFENENGNPIGDADARANVHIQYGYPGQTPQAFLGGSSDHLFQEIPNYLLDSGIDSGCVNSVACLVSNTSAALEKQGEIFAARAPREILNDWDSITDSIVALPPNREYHGLAETGAYAWWMPDTIEAANPGTVGEYSELIRKQDVLVFYLKGLSANSSFNVTFYWNVSFHTRNQLFEKRSTPPNDPEWVRVYHALALLPAASCNPEHDNLFKALVKKGSKIANDVYGHYQDHKGIYDGLISLLLSMAA